MPVDLDPQGIVGKIEHITETRDERVRGEVKKMLPNAEPDQGLSCREHPGDRKLPQHDPQDRQALLPAREEDQLVHPARAASDDNAPGPAWRRTRSINAVDTFKLGQPVGDGIGPIIASKYMANLPKQVVAKDTVMSVDRVQGKDALRPKGRRPDGIRGRARARDPEGHRGDERPAQRHHHGRRGAQARGREDGRRRGGHRRRDRRDRDGQVPASRRSRPSTRCPSTPSWSSRASSRRSRS